MPNDSSPLAPLGIPAFRNLWLANISSNMGVTFQGVGAAWLMTSLTDGAASMVALVQTASTLPVLLFALVGGMALLQQGRCPTQSRLPTAGT